MILGITGGSGCGKTTLLEEISRRGGVIFDCDKIYHRLLRSDQALNAALCARFPEASVNGAIDRTRLAKIVFSREKDLLDLNRITHRAVRLAVEDGLKTAPELAAIDAIGLFEAGLDTLCDITVAVTAPEETRIARLTVRDGICREAALSRIRAQHDDSWFRQRCDYLLENDGSLEDFQRKCQHFISVTMNGGHQP